ncbi:myosin-2 heavy chain-like [Saccostrea echinata]|uniref:myosin-2 heavy chain-like n=1 Tax=Saccostrea echinata TaxID=191078 RepID=UPI002A802208|nr:myosin-2 heavy chain-like [Saccostrea echinata]
MLILEQSKAESDSKDGDILKLNDGVTRLQSELDELRHKLKEEQSKVFWLTVDSEHSIRRKTQTDNKKTTELEVENLRFEVRILKTENKKLEEKRRRILQEKEDLSLMHSRELKLREEEIKVLIRDKEKTKLELQSLYVKNKEYEKNLKKTNQDSEIRCLKDQVNDLKKEIHILEKQADNLREEKIQIHRFLFT